MSDRYEKEWTKLESMLEIQDVYRYVGRNIQLIGAGGSEEGVLYSVNYDEPGRDWGPLTVYLTVLVSGRKSVYKWKPGDVLRLIRQKKVNPRIHVDR